MQINCSLVEQSLSFHLPDEELNCTQSEVPENVGKKVKVREVRCFNFTIGNYPVHNLSS